MGWVRGVRAELTKLAGLPEVGATVLGTIAVAAALGAGIAASSSTPLSAGEAVLVTVPYLQVGLIVLGVLAVASEYQGAQIRTSLVAAPGRGTFLAAKGLAYLVAAAVTSGAAIAAGYGAAAGALAADGGATTATQLGPLAGAAAYLLLIGALGVALTVLLRSLVAPLVAVLSLVLIASPLLATSTEHARWLPDRAAARLYLGADAVLTPATGSLVALGWVTFLAVVAGVAFLRRDA